MSAITASTERRGGSPPVPEGPTAIDPLEFLDFADDFACRYYRRGRSPDELKSLGRIGLMEACRRYDPRRGVRFETYAAYWIRREVVMGLMLDRPIHVPWHEQWAAKAGAGAPKRSRAGDADRLARRAHDARLAMGMKRWSVDDDLDGEVIAPEDHDYDALDRLLACLSPREAEAITLHLGLDGGPEHSFREVAEAMGTNKNTAGDMIARVRKKLRKALTPPPPSYP